MLSDTSLLIRTYWTIDRRGDTRQSPRRRWLAMGVAAVLGVIISFAAGSAVGRFISDPALPLRLRLGVMPGLLLTLVLLGTLVSGVNQAIRALYLANDMELLFSAPVHTSSVLTAKLVSRLPGTVTITLLLTIPALLGFGIGTGLGPAFYVSGVLALLLAPLFGLAAGALLAMLIVRVLPAARVAEYLGAASIVLGVLMAIAFQLPRLLFDGGANNVDPQTLEALNSMLDRLEAIPLPSMWAGQALVDLAEGRVTQAMGRLALYLLITAGFFSAVVLLANRVYLNGWLRMQGSGITRSGYDEQAGVFGSGSVGASIAIKDWYMRLRDARQLAGLVSGLIFAGFFGFLLLRPDNDRGVLDLAAVGPRNVTDLLLSPGLWLSGIILYAGWITFSRSASTALAIEGRSFYILKASPLPPRTIFRSKVLGIFAAYAVLTLLLLLLGWLFTRYSLAWLPYGWLCLLIIGYGMLTISTAFGFLYPRLDWDDPRRMTSGTARWRSAVLTIVYGLLALVAATAPFVLAYFWPRFALLFVLLGLLLLALMALGVERWSLRRVEQAWADIPLPD